MKVIWGTAEGSPPQMKWPARDAGRAERQYKPIYICFLASSAVMPISTVSPGT